MNDTAIVLLNLGGPLRVDRVEPFLLELFNDRDIIRLGPAFLQPWIARFIVSRRLKTVQERYTQIGGGSPILRESAAQAQALKVALRQAGRQERVRLCFRYTQPRAAGLLRSLRAQGVKRLLPVTLYPHDCRATTGSSLRDLERQAAPLGLEVIEGVRHYACDSDYLDALEELIRKARAEAPEAVVLFSAHSLPISQIQAGDPYEREILSTVNALKARLGQADYRLGYQSKVGPVKWLEPSLESVLHGLKGQEVIVVPISFVGEHIETLHELDIEYRELAEQLGIRRWLRVPALGTHPAFIRALAKLTLKALEA